jgi:hypothetical protein
MGWFGTKSSYYFTLASVNDDPLAQKYLVEPATERNESDETLFSYVFYHEAYLVHMTRKHYLGSTC